MNTSHWFASHLRDLTEQECLELLETGRVGRLAYDAPDGPMILPVNYALDGNTVLVATTAYSALAQQGSLGPVAFEVDDLDVVNESGWSVVVRGAVALVPPDELPRDTDERPRPWAEGSRTLHLRITPREITGKRLVPG